MIKKFYLYTLLFFLCGCPLIAFAQKQQVHNIHQLRWYPHELSLPAKDSSYLSEKGAFIGISHGMLLLAGGLIHNEANSKKGGVYTNKVLVFPWGKDNPDKRLDTIIQLPFSCAEGASVSVNDGILCIGGKNERGLLSTVWWLRWNPQVKNITISYLPDLPHPLSDLAVARIGQTV